jgi:ribose transport system ATP-binding protein
MISFQAISKSFAGVRVLHDVSVAVPAGHTLGLVGENGAGKSTLMNILGGNLRPDTGRMTLNSQPYAPRGPLDAAHHGIAFIHQELNLFPNLTIAENIFLTAFPRTAGLPLVHRGAMREKTASLLAQVGLALLPDTPVERLSAGERQLVEIAKALSLDARLIILDEPTTSLGSREAEKLFELVARLRQHGLAMIYISHTLGDVLRLCDDIVVLRDGEVAGTGPRIEFTAERMISLMVGRSLNQLYPTRNRSGGSAERRHLVQGVTAALGRDAVALATTSALEARHLSQSGIVRDINFSLHRGEVLGISGLMGAGRSELARILFGLDPCARGEIWLNGQPIHRAAPRDRIQRGLAFLTENRREEGLCMEAAIADNIALVSLRQHTRPPLSLLNFAGLRQALGSIRQAVRLTPSARDDAPVKMLSGGNQQKVVLAKWLLARSSVLILDEPTRGIDVGAKFEVYQLIHELADQGAGVLVISSEMEELIGICDRILVMNCGEVRDELKREEFDRERILAAALGERP